MGILDNGMRAIPTMSVPFLPARLCTAKQAHTVQLHRSAHHIHEAETSKIRVAHTVVSQATHAC